MAKSKDTYANLAAVYVEESAANTQTAAKFNFPFSIQDKVALLISRIEYWWVGLTNLNGTGDQTCVALATNASLTNITSQNDPMIVDNARVLRADLGTAASGVLETLPFIKDFANLPGGGILVAPAPLYAIVQSTGAAAVCGCWMKLFYTYKELATEEYWELVESRRIIST